MRPGIALAAGCVVLLLALGLALAEAAPRQAGSNYVPEFGPVKEFTGSDRHCQEEGLVPADAAALRLRVGTYGRPTPRIRATMSTLDGRRVSAGTLPGGRPEGIVVVPLRPSTKDSSGGIVACIETGPGGRTVFYGAGGRIRLEWLRAGEESWFALLPTVAHRFGLGKGIAIGSWLLVLAGVVLVGACATALMCAARELTR